jgi:hypothetical protein
MNISKLKHDGTKHVYAMGLVLKHGKLVRTKFYTKIYVQSPDYEIFILDFAGQSAVNLYRTKTEWMNLYPGFSGFTLGIELDNNDNQRFGFGYRDSKDGQLFFSSFLLNEKREILDRQKYDYFDKLNVKISDFNKMERTLSIFNDTVKYLEIHDKSWALCPIYNYAGIPQLEHDIWSCLDEENRHIFDKIKKDKKDYKILNYGSNARGEDKIYLVHQKNRELGLLEDLYHYLK